MLWIELRRMRPGMRGLEAEQLCGFGLQEPQASSWPARRSLSLEPRSVQGLEARMLECRWFLSFITWSQAGVSQGSRETSL